MIPPPGFQCREATNSAAVLAAVGGIGDCSPDDSGVAVTNLTACSSIYTIWLAFINQIKVAFCYIFGQLTDLQDQIDAISTMRTPGSVNITVGAGAGVGGTASIAGNDTAGQITINSGTVSGAPGLVFTLGFPTPYATAGILHMEAANSSSAAQLPKTTATVSGATGTTAGSALNDDTTYLFNYVVLGGT